MVVGGIVIATSAVIYLARLFSVYGMVDDCLDMNTSCSMEAVFLAGTIALLLGITGAVVLIGGFVISLISRPKKK